VTVACFVRGAAAFEGDARTLRPAILPPMLRRRTSPLSRAVAEVLGRLADATGADLGRLPIVHATSHGEIGVTVALLAAVLDPDGDVSPTRFHNSVHNTACGYVSIACGNRAGHTTLAAGPDTAAMALVEAAARLATGDGDVLVVCADEPVPPPLPPRPPAAVTAAAFHLAAARPGARLVLEGPAAPDPRDARAGTPAEAAAALAHAITSRRPGPVVLSSLGPFDGDGGHVYRAALSFAPTDPP